GMPIAATAKEIAIRQAMAFPFLEDVCIGRTRSSCRGLDERLRRRGEQFDEALSLVRRADRRLARKQTVEQLQLIARIRKSVILLSARPNKLRPQLARRPGLLWARFRRPVPARGHDTGSGGKGARNRSALL